LLPINESHFHNSAAPPLTGSPRHKTAPLLEPMTNWTKLLDGAYGAKKRSMTRANRRREDHPSYSRYPLFGPSASVLVGSPPSPRPTMPSA